ncbi:TnpV protein [Ruminococcus sp.]|uniref:TnpV protein n=1 Tax=Ruminococcus sp. TaxID=41978 RepID=UPI0025E6754C|nr:TnpV protein [Ruminococcus sp.]MBR1432714.1 TnpV protein [Ruminococcus sp.]
MTYEEWKALSEEQKMEVPETEYPQIPKDKLENGLVEARLEKKDGQLGWTIVQKVGDQLNTIWIAEITTETKTSGEVTIEQTYLLNPYDGLYIPLIQNEPSMEEQPIGMYGRMWMENMEKNYPAKVELMMFYHRYLTVARSVNERAENYQEQLSDQYDRNNPRPTTGYEAILEWETQKKYQIDHLIMTEVVLVPVTTP